MAKGIYYAVGGRNVHKSTVDAHPHPGKCLKAIKYIKWKLKTPAQVKRSRGDDYIGRI
jgi:hypothetical protein